MIMMRHLSIDIETYSSVNIGKSGLYKYVQSPDFMILLFAYSRDYEPVQIVDLAQGEMIPADILFALNDPNVIKHAYNAAFEWYCLNKFGKSPLEQWHCTMLHGLYCGYPAGLEATGKALGLPQEKQKLLTGRRLIKVFCTPTKPSKANGGRTRTWPKHEPEKWKLFKEYCKQDVVTEMEIERRLSGFPVPEEIQSQWVRDQKQNAFGVALDLELVKGALTVDSTVKEELTAEAKQLTGLANPNSTAQLKPWLEKQLGQPLENLQKDTVADLLAQTEDSKTKRVLQLRQEMAKTSVKKYAAMDAAVGDDGRIRGLMQFYGANRTGRWAGRLVQLQNLTKNKTDMLDFARELVKGRKTEAIKAIFGNVPDLLSQLIRTCFIAAPGNKIISADFSAIEARVLSWLAQEGWRLEVFATHGKIYEASASAMFGVPIEHIVKGRPEYALRQKGKVAELALGYQGGSGALIQMGALKMGLSEDELPDIVSRWRQSNKRIVDFWYKMENAAISVIREGRPAGVAGMLLQRELDLERGQDFFTIQLPSGRKLFYNKPFLAPNQWGNDSLHYYGMNQTTKKWGEQDTYGGKLTENVVQAIARDCLAEALKRLEAAGYQVVFTVHDEAILEVPQSVTVEEICIIMGQPISWAPGLSLPADGFASAYYKKD